MNNFKYRLNQAVLPGLTLFRQSFKNIRQRARTTHLTVIGAIVVALMTFSFAQINAVAFTGERIELASLSKGSLQRYARSMQSKVADTPYLLTRLTGEDVKLILAAPEMDRFDGPTTVWQYRTDACVLDVYFSARNAQVDAAQVTHFDIRARIKDNNVQEQACLNDLYDTRAVQIAQAFEQIFAFYAYERDPLEG